MKHIIMGILTLLAAGLFVWWGFRNNDFFTDAEAEHISEMLKRNSEIVEEFGEINSISKNVVGSEKGTVDGQVSGKYVFIISGSEKTGKVIVLFRYKNDKIEITDIEIPK